MIKLNGEQYKTARPTDLDEQLLAATGCSSAEIDTLLTAGVDRVAAAARPFLAAEVLPGLELNRAIAADAGAREEIRTLYVKVPAAEKPADPQGGTK